MEKSGNFFFFSCDSPVNFYFSVQPRAPKSPVCAILPVPYLLAPLPLPTAQSPGRAGQWVHGAGSPLQQLHTGWEPRTAPKPPGRGGSQSGGSGERGEGERKALGKLGGTSRVLQDTPALPRGELSSLHGASKILLTPA